MVSSPPRRGLLGALTLAIPAVLLAPAPAHAQQVAGGGPEKLGVNLDDVLDYSTQWVFVDVFKHARDWVSQDVGFGGPWNNGLPLNFDANGWPLLAPNQAAGTLLCNDIDGKYPGGVYTCYYDGTGDILFGNDAFVLTKQPGVITMNVTPGNGGIYVKLIESDPLDPVRNIRVVMPGFENSYQTDPFHPLFLERLKPYGLLRFLRFQKINDSPLADWADRTTPATWSQATANGVALEYIIDLSNRLEKDVWIHIPHLADDNHVTQLATKLRDELDPDLHIYVEYSNEVWNTIYDQGVYAQTNGLIAGYDTDPWRAGVEWGSERAVQCFDIFYNVFGAAAPTRLTRAMGGMAAFTGPSEWALDFNNANLKTDVLAIAPYFASNFGFPDQAPTTITWDLPTLLNECDKSITGETLNWITSNKAVADARGVGLVAAEGGQRMAAEGPFVGNATLTQLFIDANRDPQMKVLYDKYLQQWQTVTGNQLMVGYVNVREYGTFGAYGILEYQDQPVAEAPKYQAMLDWSAGLIGSKPYGTGCGTLEIATDGVPKVGNATHAMTLKGADANTAAFLVVGFSNTNWLGIPLPLDLIVLFAPGCSLYASLDIVKTATTDGSGKASIPLPIPNNPALANVSVYSQWAASNPAVNPPLFLEFSQGLELIVQP